MEGRELVDYVIGEFAVPHGLRLPPEMLVIVSAGGRARGLKHWPVSCFTGKKMGCVCVEGHRLLASTHGGSSHTWRE